MTILRRLWARPTLVFLLLALGGLLVRLDHLDRAFELQPARQYMDAIHARGIYARTSDQMTPEHRHLAMMQALPDAEDVYEPQVLETAAAAGYSMGGAEMLWIPRLLAALGWLVGGWFLFFLAREMRNQAAALASVLFYLFTPFAVVGSRSFQPDSFLVAGYVLTAYMLYSKGRGNHRFVVAMMVSGVVSLVKPQAAALMIPLFLALSVHDHGLRKSFLGARAVLFVGATVIPAGLWVMTVGTGATSGVFFAPSLFLQGEFFRGWVNSMNSVVGIVVLVAAIGGACLYARGRAAALMIGLAAGYLALAFAFNYRVETHNYYSLPLIVFVSLGLGLILTGPRGRARAVLQGIAVAGLLFSGLIEWSFVNPFNDPFESAARAQLYTHLGDVVGHSDSALILEPTYERAIEFYGWVAGRRWPANADVYVNSLAGIPAPTAVDLMATFQRQRPARWFIVADMGELQAQPGLQALLRQHKLVESRANYAVYDLAN